MTKKKAFTIIELMLAMSFLGTMLVGIATLIMQITNIYQKGLAIRSINSNGREIISDITRTVNASRVNIDINPEVPDSGKVEQKQINEARAQYFLHTEDSEKRQLGGVFCTGDYSYVWNTADNLRIARTKYSDDLREKRYVDNAIVANEMLNDHIYLISVGKPTQYVIPKFARFADKDRRACAYDKSEAEHEKYVPGIDTEVGTIKTDPFLFSLGDDRTLDAITELIEDNESDLAMYNFTMFPATQHITTKQIFYSGTFILATYRGGVNIKSNGDFCEGSDDENGYRDSEITLNDFDYCAVNKFNFSSRATGETGINKHGE